MQYVTDKNRHWWILGTTSLILGITVLDETIVGVALTSIRSDLKLSEVASHWVVNAYLLTFTCFVAVGGRLGDILGHQIFFIAGAFIFGIASALCGFASDGLLLVAGRALQGIGTAIIFPASLAMTTAAFPPRKRGVAFGIQVTIAAVFMSSGPLLGGILTEELSWRWIFWINIPIAVVIVSLIYFAVGSGDKTKSHLSATGLGSVDIRGPACLIVGVCSLTAALMQGVDWGWSNPKIIFLFIFGTALLSIFVFIELSMEEPIFELNLFRIKTFTAGDIVFFVFQFNKIVTFVFVSVYLQVKQSMSPVLAGATLAICVMPTLITSFSAGKIADRYGARMPLMIGLIVNGFALIVVGTSMKLANMAILIGALVCWGATLPFLAITARRTLMSAVPATHRGQAGGLNLSIQMLGGTVGMALASIVLSATGDYGLIFVLTGILTIVTMTIVFYFIE